MFISGKSIFARRPCFHLPCKFSSARFNLRKGFNWELQDQIKPFDFQQADEVFIKDLPRVKSKIQALREGGASELRIVTDFDKTLTRFRKSKGQRSSCCFRLFDDLEGVNDLYKDISKKLVNTYIQFENGNEIEATQEQSRYMEEWLRLSKQALLNEKNFTYQTVLKAIAQRKIIMRLYAKDFLKLCMKFNLPLYIISGGLQDVIELILYDFLDPHIYTNLKIHSNKMIFDKKNGDLLGFDESNVYHSFNKSAHLSQYSANFKNKNVILMGDSLYDIQMTKGMESKTQLSICFINHLSFRANERFKDTFDIIIKKDGTFWLAYLLLMHILKIQENKVVHGRKNPFKNFNHDEDILNLFESIVS